MGALALLAIVGGIVAHPGRDALAPELPRAGVRRLQVRQRRSPATRPRGSASWWAPASRWPASPSPTCYLQRPGTTASRRALPHVHRVPRRPLVLRRALRRAVRAAHAARFGRFGRYVVESALRAGHARGRRHAASCAPAPSLARGAQSGYLRAYAMLLLLGLRRPWPSTSCSSRRSEMTVYLSIILFLPAVLGRARRCSLPRRARALGAGGRHLLTLAYSIVMLARFQLGGGGLQFVTDDNWISELGIRYRSAWTGSTCSCPAHRACSGCRPRSPPRCASGTGRACSTSSSASARRRCSARSWRRTSRCSSSSST